MHKISLMKFTKHSQFYQLEKSLTLIVTVKLIELLSTINN